MIFTLIKIIFFLPFIGLIITIRPFKHIRIGYLGCERIGNFYEAELYKIYYKNNIKYFDIWTHGLFYSNSQFEKLVNRNFKIYYGLKNFYFILNLLSKYLPYLENHLILKSKEDFTFDKKMKLFQSKNICKLNSKEKKQGDLFLKKLKIPLKAKIICLSIRDSNYLKKRFPKLDFSYHNFRDTEPNDFKKAIKLLLSEGFYIFRMGKEIEKKLNFKHKRLIEISFLDDYDDFLDFYLAQKCYFWIGTGSGLDNLAVAYKKPCLFINFIPPAWLPLHRGKIVVTLKKFYSQIEKKYLSLKKIFDDNLTSVNRTEIFKEKKIKIVNNDFNEIKNSVANFLKLLKNDWKLSNMDNKLKNKFLNKYRVLLKKKKLDKKFHGNFFTGHVCPSFIKNNMWLLR